MENTELDTTLLKRIQRIFKTDEEAFNFFLEDVEIKFRCNLCRKPQSNLKYTFKCCQGKQNVFQEHKFVVDGEKNRISRMPFRKTLAAFYFCYQSYLVYGDKFKNLVNFRVFHTYVGNFYMTTFHFKKKKFKKLESSDFKKYNKLFEKLAEKLNTLEN